LCHCTSISDVWKDQTAFTFDVEQSRLDLLGSEHKGTMILQNIWNYSHNHTAFHPIRPQSSIIIIITTTTIIIIIIIIKTSNLARVNELCQRRK
jgi:hypothetical protein